MTVPTVRMTPDEMAAELAARIDGPHTDDDTAGVARLISQAVRFLNHATLGEDGLTYPATACGVTGDLAVAAARLSQLTEQMGRFLAHELAAGRLGEDSGRDPADAVSRADDYLAAAGAAAVPLGDVLSAAQNSLATVHQARSAQTGASA